MNVKSKLDTEDENSINQHSEYMRGGCGTPFSMISGSTRLDVSNIHAPKFILRIFRTLGWKTEPDQRVEE